MPQTSMKKRCWTLAGQLYLLCGCSLRRPPYTADLAPMRELLNDVSRCSAWGMTCFVMHPDGPALEVYVEPEDATP